MTRHNSNTTDYWRIHLVQYMTIVQLLSELTLSSVLAVNDEVSRLFCFYWSFQCRSIHSYFRSVTWLPSIITSSSSSSLSSSSRIVLYMRIEIERKGKEEYLYSAFIQRLVSRRSDMDHTVLPANYTIPAFPS